MCLCGIFDRRRMIFHPTQVVRTLLSVEIRRDVTVLVCPLVCV